MHAARNAVREASVQYKRHQPEKTLSIKSLKRIILIFLITWKVRVKPCLYT